MPIDPNNPGLCEGVQIRGYHLQRVVALREIDCIFYELEHTATRARHVHISNKDTRHAAK